MNYTYITLLGFGLFGVLAHTFVDLSRLNKEQKGNVKISKYWQFERFNIAVSVIVVIISVFASQEIKQLEMAGKWLGLAFAAIGYMGESLLVFFIGKAKSTIGDNTTV